MQLSQDPKSSDICSRSSEQKRQGGSRRCPACDQYRDQVREVARAYGVIVDSSTDLFCSTGPNANVCAVRLKGELVSQVETFAGVSVRF